MPELSPRPIWEQLGRRDWHLVALALAVGAGAGLGAVAFRYLIEGFTWLFAGHSELGVGEGAVSPIVPGIGGWCVVLAPVAGGLLYGPLVARFAPEARGHGVPEVMLAVSRNAGRIRPRVPVVKSLASAICIGSGGSVGREGPIVQIGSALGSAIGQVAKLPARRLRLLVACGAAGGIAATFNAPIAGVFFALEVILRDFEAASFGVVVLSSVTAAAIGRIAFGTASFLPLPHFQLNSPSEYVLYVVLGVMAALCALLFVRVLYGAEDAADRIWRGPEWLRPAAGGLLLGVLLLVLPQMYGVGYPVLEAAVGGHYVIAFLAVLMVGKIVATSVTIAIGGSGGVFAPSLFMGAMLGSGYGQALHSMLPGTVASPGAYGLVGMAAVFGAAARAPITAVLIIFELTGDYAIILPLMVAVAVASGLSGVLTRETIYTLKLRRRGIDVEARPVGAMQTVPVADAMRGVPLAVAADLGLDDLIERLSRDGERGLPVVARDGSICGVISMADVEEAISESPGDAVVASDLARPATELHADDRLDEAARLLAESEEPGLPVLGPAGSEIVGWVTHRDVLRAYQRAVRPSQPRAAVV